MKGRAEERLRLFFARASGLTLVEILVTVVVYSIVITAAYSVLTSGIMTWQVNNVKVELQQDLRKAMDWMMLDLRQAGAVSIDDVPVSNSWSTVITFSVANGVSGGVTIWTSDKIKYYLSGTLLKRQYGASVRDIAQDITVLQVRRPVSAPNTVEVNLQAQRQTIQGNTVPLSQSFVVKLRN
ncbi:MAG TPA: prepilin-type N-terminal cleavage/methylation domain-containing protein [Candidatus Omnitrophota bacterium]|jgi:prepilin-type N-terminal cleavage/methylation domain-containing protein|nr:prepilin-type N-terminal cleavage/methylation domain-containing protein [Candidatus Omnitrophota bacterium]HPN57157.1 prepilin-type N-terminal cleavage/methylation domain-containing protein [Candidatus Omnitrophota bacterium]